MSIRVTDLLSEIDFPSIFSINVPFITGRFFAIIVYKDVIAKYLITNRDVLDQVL